MVDFGEGGSGFIPTPKLSLNDYIGNIKWSLKKIKLTFQLSEIELP